MRSKYKCICRIVYLMLYCPLPACFIGNVRLHPISIILNQYTMNSANRLIINQAMLQQLRKILVQYKRNDDIWNL